MRNHHATSVLHQGHLYGCSGSRLRCVAWDSGEVRWQNADVGKGAVALADGRLVVLTEDGDLILAEAAPKEYCEKGRCRPLEGPCLTGPVIAAGRLFIRNERLLVALELRCERP